VNSIWVAHVTFFNVYPANHPREAAMTRSMPLTGSPRLIDGPVDRSHFGPNHWRAGLDRRSICSSCDSHGGIKQNEGTGQPVALATRFSDGTGIRSRKTRDCGSRHVEINWHPRTTKEQMQFRCEHQPSLVWQTMAALVSPSGRVRLAHERPFYHQ